jgi:Transposase DDE domain
VGYDTGKKVKGRKIHALVNTEGLPMRMVVYSAAIQDRHGAGLVLDKIRRRFPWLELIWAYGGYNVWQIDAAVAKVPLLRMGIVERSDDMKGFVVCRAAGWSSELSLVRPKPTPCQGLRKPRRNPGHLRYPRLDPAGLQAACQGVGRELYRFALMKVCKPWKAVLPRRKGQRRGCAESRHFLDSTAGAASNRNARNPAPCWRLAGCGRWEFAVKLADRPGQKPTR